MGCILAVPLISRTHSLKSEIFKKSAGPIISILVRNLKYKLKSCTDFGSYGSPVAFSY